MCAEAYRKAVHGLSSATRTFDHEEEQHWARELLHDFAVFRNVQPPQSATLGKGPGEEAESSQKLLKPLAGVRFCPETAPGRCGRQPEHIRDMLACARRRATRRLLAAMRAMDVMMDARQLPQ